MSTEQPANRLLSENIMSAESTIENRTDFEEPDNAIGASQEVECTDANPWTVPVNRDADGAVIGIGLFVSEEELRVMGIDPDEHSEITAVARPNGLQIKAAD